MEESNNKIKMSITKKIILGIVLAVILAIASFIIYEVATVNNTYYIGQKNLQIPIFVYHDLVEDKSQIEYDYMQTTVERFEKQITGLIKLGVYKYAYEIAKKYNIPMTSFLIDDCVGIPGYYTWDEAREMHDSGLISIYSHGLTHDRYSEVDKDVLVEQTEQAYKNLQTNLNDENLLKVFTYPYGLCTAEERTALDNAGFIQNLTDNRINLSNRLDLSGLHRSYPLNNSLFKILLKIQYRVVRYH